MNRLRIYQDPCYRDHLASINHPESPARLQAIADAINAAPALKDAEFSGGVPVERSALERVHDPEYLDDLAEWCRQGTFIASAEIPVDEKSWHALRHAAGAAVDAVASAVDDEIDAAFLAIRPPGHHAERDRALGFCLVNNVAIAAGEALARGLERVAILDFDLHHGNGTQHIFWDEPRVLFISIHEAHLYPAFTGSVDERGGPNAIGKNINIPLKAGSGDEALHSAFDEICDAAISSFQPQLLLLSAGFDGHVDDPLGSLRYSDDGYKYISNRVLQWSAVYGCKIVSILEGGYNTEVLARCVTDHCTMLLEGKS